MSEAGRVSLCCARGEAGGVGACADAGETALVRGMREPGGSWGSCATRVRRIFIEAVVSRGLIAWRTGISSWQKL